MLLMPTVLTVIATAAVTAMFSMLAAMAVFTVTASFIVMVMLPVALSFRDHAGTGKFLAPLTAGGAQITMPAAAGAYILVFFHVYQ